MASRHFPSGSADQQNTSGTAKRRRGGLWNMKPVRGVILGVCAVVAGGTFLAMYLSVWSTRDHSERAAAFRQHIVSELVWVTIPILMLIAAALPAVIAVMSGGSAH
jgi:heme/copper-type cytochrome/quinol oxidase subunit 2